MATPATANRPTRMRVTKSAADKPASAASKRSTIAPSRPVVARSRSFERSSVSRNSGSSGRKKPRGCGSKVSAAAGRPSVLAARQRRCDDGAMAAVHPVEIADGQHRAVERVSATFRHGPRRRGGVVAVGRPWRGVNEVSGQGLTTVRPVIARPRSFVQAERGRLPVQPAHHRLGHDARGREDVAKAPTCRDRRGRRAPRRGCPR